MGGGRRGRKKAEGAEGDVNFRASGTEPRAQTKQRKGACHITYLRAAQSHEPKQNKGRAPVTEFSCERNRATNPNKTKEGHLSRNFRAGGPSQGIPTPPTPRAHRPS